MSQYLRDKIFVHLLAANYAHVKEQFPGEGRRKWHLRVLQEFWASNTSTPSGSSETLPADDFMQDSDPLDYLVDGDGLCTILRTDYSDESAWQSFCTTLREAEADLKSTLSGIQDKEDALQEGNAQMEDAYTHQDDNDSASEESDDDAPPLVNVISATSPELRVLFSHVSNIVALRLLNDVDIRSCPPPPAGTKPNHPPNRLIDQDGLQEIYVGSRIWIYDAQSNNDQCARLVSQQGDIYGTATGDSWRARVTHICELQFNMSYLGMKIDFGGLDRWDYNERQRNAREAVLLQA